MSQLAIWRKKVSGRAGANASFWRYIWNSQAQERERRSLCLKITAWKMAEINLERSYKAFLGQEEDIGFYSMCDQKPLEIFEQSCDCKLNSTRLNHYRWSLFPSIWLKFHDFIFVWIFRIHLPLPYFLYMKRELPKIHTHTYSCYIHSYTFLLSIKPNETLKEKYVYY